MGEGGGPADNEAYRSAKVATLTLSRGWMCTNEHCILLAVRRCPL